MAPATALRARSACTRTSRSFRTVRAAARRCRATNSDSPTSTPTRSTRARTCASPSPTPTSHELGGATHLAVWTTTPWTLLSNVGGRRQPRDHLRGRRRRRSWPRTSSSRSSATARVPSATFPGSALAGVHYQRPFSDVDAARGRRRLLRRAAPTTSRSTKGPASCTRRRPSVRSTVRSRASTDCRPLNPVGPDGKFTAEVPWLEGQDVRDANHAINDELERRGTVASADWTTSTPCRTAGAAAPCSSTGASRVGTWRRARSARSCSPRTRPSTGTPSTSATAGSASGWTTTSTGRSRAIASGARRCRSGAAPTITSRASGRSLSSRPSPAAT